MKYKGRGLLDKLMVGYIRKVPNHPFKIRFVNWINDLIGGVNLQTSNNATYNFSTREYIGAEIIYSKAYEPLTLSRCETILNEGGTFIDIGANMGLFSIYLSINPIVKTYSIEPSAENFQNLINNIHLNNLKNITPINIGLSDKDSFGYLNNVSGGNSGTIRVDKNPGNEQSYLIRLTTLAEIVKELGIKDIDLIKIDVEGYEMNVFKGFFPNAIRPKNIIMEYSDYMSRTGYKMADCYNYFIELGYEAFDVNGKEYKLYEDLPESNSWWTLKG